MGNFTIADFVRESFYFSLSKHNLISFLINETNNSLPYFDVILFGGIFPAIRYSAVLPPNTIRPTISCDSTLVRDTQQNEIPIE